MDRCRSCGAEITWKRTERGRLAPFDPDGTTHFVTCPDRRAWRKTTPARPAQPSLLDERPPDSLEAPG
jgi:hypothetical protein